MKKNTLYRHGIALMLAGTAAAGLLSGCEKKNEKTAADAGQEASAAPLLRDGASIRLPSASPLRKAISVAIVTEQTIERSISVPGAIEADAARLIKVVPPVSGRIVQLNKRLGDSVKAGDALFSLDSADLASAYSDAGKASATLNLARRNLQRQKDLVDADIAARKDLEQAESDYTQAVSEADRAKARLSQLGASLGPGSGHLYQLRSPISGKVIELTGSQGGFWNDTNAPVMTVADLSTVWMAASIQEKDLPLVFIGQSAKISVNAFEGESIEGKVRYIGDVLDPDTRTVKVRIAIDNQSGRFKPGMFAKVVFSGQPHPAPAVPAAALVQNGFNTRVFVEKSPWVFEPRIVKTGAQMGNNIEILSGLKAGEKIVAKDGVLLND
ncbi:efflux RND transporter periplasmic adaptor subunit [Undibacterium terreum]|uniref:RND transporter n=1 Tax=Undibacterium terreum TaxID=1224302 RepID=A0A916XFE1_9BURK|nr:efflux RND transporter periplasmic adaptor subunit [Undibacterium terreum]GGC67847.1 RND transporter [Undibacterium terreum]